ncbi:2-oxo acid dehydrogenase subunit E2 [Nocardia bovistercoris]|uniref:Dihydrolipoamide acetyltransferase component of pyruvate dehydrogenase complex n=1 Tax=Nocardia bovistercoris TaxID=2785916 RepID=A0A931N8G2_9NOCA|nr:2-oxo acid dehydrogenase subunit E2 [Nocardia bovistercoris]MBH0781748.1 2-oxo acid dehydrogenase subunit E2 [Nocardia bovistercoris]
MVEFRMPSLGADMTEGTVLRWLVQPGDTVHSGDILAEVDTTKAAIEIESFDDGVIGSLLVPEGATVPVGTPLATIDAGVDAPHPTRAPKSAIRATPLIRRLAEEAGLDLARVHGSGPEGRIVRADIARAVGARSSPDRPNAEVVAAVGEPSTGRDSGAHDSRERRVRSTEFTRASGYARRLAADSGIDLAELTATHPDAALRARDLRPADSEPTVRTRPDQHRPSRDSAPPTDTARTHRHDPGAVRTAIATAMARSKQSVPHYYLSSTIDLDAAVRLLRERNRQVPVPERVLTSALLLCAAARAAKRVPESNGHWVDDAFRPATAVHLGVVVSTREGIVLPTIPDADTLDPAAMMRALREVVTRARAARLRSADTVPATITVTNLGDLGVDSVFGVIAVPQVAIVGFGAVTERPCAVDGMLGIRPQVCATLSADHRASDGATGARYLNTISDLLQRPEEL